MDKVKDFADDFPENAQKLATDAGAAVKDFAEDFPENAQKFATDAGTAVKGLADDAAAKAKDLFDGDDEPSA